MPFLSRIYSAWAWRRFQRHFDRLERSPVTQVVGRARKARKAIVHAALAAELGRRG